MKLKSSLKFSLLLLLGQTLALQAVSVTQIAGGNAHSLFLKSDGSLWAMGLNYYGELGDGTVNNTNRPEQIIASGVTNLAAGENHSLFIKSDGSLWAMGSESYGQLGDGVSGANLYTNKPEQIVASGVVAVAAGAAHSLFVKSDGSLWGMGNDSEGELGDGLFIGSTNKPEQIIASGVKAVAAALYYSLFLKTDGSLWAMGDNGFGELGDGTYNSTNQPEQIVASGVVAVATGGGHTLFIKSDGSLWGFGGEGGYSGQAYYNFTNQPEQIIASNVVAVAVGEDHSLFVKSDGSLWGFGNDLGGNYSGQLGDGTYNSTNQPEQIIASGVAKVAAGYTHSLLVKADGSLWVMGDNSGSDSGHSSGELGDGFVFYYSDFFGVPVSGRNPVPEQIVPTPQPVLTETVSSKTNLQFTATCRFGGTFYLLAGTNVTQALNQWTPVWTNSINVRSNNNFNATISSAVSPGNGPKFYILRSQ
jgi:alpha-tubulin suppressor-like RCC1 family protein